MRDAHKAHKSEPAAGPQNGKEVEKIYIKGRNNIAGSRLQLS